MIGVLMQVEIEYLGVTNVVDDQPLFDADLTNAFDCRVSQPRHCLGEIIVNDDGRAKAVDDVEEIARAPRLAIDNVVLFGGFEDLGDSRSVQLDAAILLLVVYDEYRVHPWMKIGPG
jgi:hypothetical protein